MSHTLVNYLRTHRRKAGLLQEECAFLLGLGCPTTVSCFERSSRKPRLETVLAYEILFGESLQKLFAGEYEKVEQEVVTRVQALAKKLRQQKPSPIREQKLAALEAVAHRADAKGKLPA